jgi:hypothetical protein
LRKQSLEAFSSVSNTTQSPGAELYLDFKLNIINQNTVIPACAGMTK